MTAESKIHHAQWQDRVIAENPFVIVGASNQQKIIRCPDLEDAKRELARLPSYTHSKIYKRADSDSAANCIVVVSVSERIAQQGPYTGCAECAKSLREKGLAAGVYVPVNLDGEVQA